MKIGRAGLLLLIIEFIGLSIITYHLGVLASLGVFFGPFLIYLQMSYMFNDFFIYAPYDFVNLLFYYFLIFAQGLLGIFGLIGVWSALIAWNEKKLRVKLTHKRVSIIKKLIYAGFIAGILHVVYLWMSFTPTSTSETSAKFIDDLGNFYLFHLCIFGWCVISFKYIKYFKEYDRSYKALQPTVRHCAAHSG